MQGRVEAGVCADVRESARTPLQFRGLVPIRLRSERDSQAHTASASSSPDIDR